MPSLTNADDSTSECPSKSSSTPGPQQFLRAVYATPCDSAFTYTKTISLATNPTLEETNTYLSTLKLAIGDLQEKINVELTRRMEEDNAKLAMIESEGDVVIPPREDVA
ncbi:putative gon7 family protein [Golovinomyces cichoracearum]|uniref:EKC/KEOPS complex subunit GON7 n=1 Tax=Golovinomyces cichoracearum TaxID=62708 RepID=A0A420HIN7_9PEZI|nr:putative gon7 family protein [Golovinomyces cichoracearum]